MSFLTNVRTKALHALVNTIADALPNPDLEPSPDFPSSDVSLSTDTANQSPTQPPTAASVFQDAMFGPSLTGGKGAARLGDLSTGLGIPGHDPFYSQFWSRGTLSNDSTNQIDALLRDGLAQKAIMTPWTDAIRPWFDIRGLTPHHQDLVQNHLLRLNAKHELFKLNILGDAWGDAITVIGADDFPAPTDDPRQEIEHFCKPLDLDQLSHEGKILWLRSFGRNAGDGRSSGYTRCHQAGPSTPRFGKPLYYQIHDFYAPAEPGFTDISSIYAGSVYVHFSRTLSATALNGESLFIKIDPYLKAYQGALAAAGQLLRTASVSFIKIKHWLHKTRNNRAESHARLSLAALSLSVLGAIFLDWDEESHEFQNRTLTGVSDIIGKLQEALAASFNAPLAVIFGTEPQGFASAEEVTERYYASVLDRQTKITPQAKRLVELILTAYVPAHERPHYDDWHIEWRPLRNPSELEKAKIREATFQALKVENEAIAAGAQTPGALTAKEIRSVQGADRFSVDPVLDPVQTPTMPANAGAAQGQLPTPSQDPNAVPDDAQDAEMSEEEMYAKEQAEKDAKTLEELQRLGHELKTAKELAEQFNLPVNRVKRLLSRGEVRSIPGHGRNGSRAYSLSDFRVVLQKTYTQHNFTDVQMSSFSTEQVQVENDPLENYHTARQVQPGEFQEIKVFKTLKNGVLLRGGRQNGEDEVTVQSVWLPAKWSVAKAKKWLKDHDFSVSLFEPSKMS